MDERTICEILSGQRRGIGPAMVRCALSVASLGYGAAVAVRNAAFDHGWRRMHRVSVPVVSVGNFTTGGTGKTPFVAWLIDELRRRGLEPGLLSRGYRSLNGSENDEARVIERVCPGVPHVQNRNRVAGARALLATSRIAKPQATLACGFAIREVNALILDDGFQHRRLFRDLDIVLIDALQPWGYGRLLPRGLLREPPSALRRADVVLITRADQIEPGALEELRHQLRVIRGIPADGEIAFRPTRLVNAVGDVRPLASLNGRTTAAFCGIGNPTGFERSLRQFGVTGPCRTFPDHHHYTADDFAALEAWRRSVGADCLVTTLKDLVKAPRNAEPIWAVDIAAHWLSGREQFESLLAAILSQTDTRAAA
jgi:tetraacyldisaccharide 4'-kinase